MPNDEPMDLVPLVVVQKLEKEKNEEETRRRKLEKLLGKIRDFAGAQFEAGNIAMGKLYSMVCDGMRDEDPKI